MNWKESVVYFKNEKVLLRMVLDFNYIKKVSESNFGEDTKHAKTIHDFVKNSKDNKKRYLDFVYKNFHIQ